MEIADVDVETENLDSTDKEALSVLRARSKITHLEVIHTEIHMVQATETKVLALMQLRVHQAPT